METALMITVVIAFVAALIAMLLTIWDCDFKWVKIFLSIAAISTIGMIIVVSPNCHAFTDNYRGRNINK